MLKCCAFLGAASSDYRGGLQPSHLQVSRVLKLPIPAKSTQLLGKDFVGEEGRGANLIDIGNGTVVVRATLPYVPAKPRPEQWLTMACSANDCHLHISQCMPFAERMSFRCPSPQDHHVPPCDVETSSYGKKIVLRPL